MAGLGEACTHVAAISFAANSDGYIATQVAFNINYVGSTQNIGPFSVYFFSPKSNSLFGVLRLGDSTTAAQVAVGL